MQISNIQKSQDNTTTDDAMSVETSETSCICMDTPEVSCYPDGCHRSHVICFPYCVSQYTFLCRIHNSFVRCPCCRNEFQQICVNSIRQPIPDYAQVTRANLPVSLQNRRLSTLLENLQSNIIIRGLLSHKITKSS